MSADNWAYCPRCTARQQALLDQQADAVDAKYGKVPVEKFDQARRQHAEAVAAFARRERTFREDYEITGADTGIVTVSYSGSCTKCKLSLKFTDTHAIPGAYPGA
jgi:hypothetical protein